MLMKMSSHARRRGGHPPARVKPRRHRNHLGTITTLTAAVLSALYGETSTAVPAASEDTALQEVVVTATRREMSAQDLPISITAVTGASLDQAGINDISGLAHSMAGVNVTDQG